MRNLIRKILKESDFDWVGKVEPIVTNIQGLLYGTKPKNIGIYGSRIKGWDHIKVLEDDGEFVKFNLCCIGPRYGPRREYRDTVYYARSSDIRQRGMGPDFLEESDFDWTTTEEDPWRNVPKDTLNQIDSDVLNRIVSILDWEVDYSKSDAYEHDPCGSVRFEIDEVFIEEVNEVVVSYISYCDDEPTHLTLWYNIDTDEHHIA